MDKRKLGQLEVSPIGMGCMGFSHGYGQVPPEAYAIEAIRGAYDYGCTHFDTAEAYGKEQFYAGHNEELVGKAIEPFRKKVVLATKFHIGELSKPDETNLYREVRRHLEDSMSRLRTDYIDLYYLHRISEAVRLEDVATVMGRLIQEGLIRGWGLSQVSADQIRAAHKITPLSAVQNIYSMVERDCETEIFPVCLEKGIGVVPFSPIASGFLSGKVTPQDQFGFDDVRKFVPNYRKRISRPTSPYSICCIGSLWRNMLPTPRYRLRGCSINIPMSYLFPVPRIRKGFWRIWELGMSRFPMMNSGSYNQRWMNVKYTDIVGVWKRNRRVSVNNGVKKQISELSHIQSGTE